MTIMKMSERFACRVVGQQRSTQRREPVSITPGDPDAALRAWLPEWAKTLGLKYLGLPVITGVRHDRRGVV
jgi:hypothetical protein